MLKLRILSALVAAPLVLASIFLLPLPWFAFVFGVLAGLALFEFGRLAGIETPARIALYLTGCGALALLLWFVPEAWLPLLAGGVVLWLLGFVIVLRFPASSHWLDGAKLGWAGYAVILSAWVSLVVVRDAPGGSWLLVWLFILVWGADIGAYFAGRAFGRRKLAVRVSPGKTWEGVAGGMMLALAACLAMAVLVPALAEQGRSLAQWTVWVLVLGGISVFGDLFESALKRHHGVKDSGTMFPGHGGMLDRVDSVLAVLPFFAVAVTYG